MDKKTKQFKIIIERDEDGYFVASVPSLPGCYTQAKTLDELKKRIHDAISLCLKMKKTDSQYRDIIRDFSYEPIFIGLETVAV